MFLFNFSRVLDPEEVAESPSPACGSGTELWLPWCPRLPPSFLPSVHTDGRVRPSGPGLNALVAPGAAPAPPQPLSLPHAAHCPTQLCLCLAFGL